VFIHEYGKARLGMKTELQNELGQVGSELFGLRRLSLGSISKTPLLLTRTQHFSLVSIRFSFYSE